jgi:flagellar hook-length control protein FliK
MTTAAVTSPGSTSAGPRAPTALDTRATLNDGSSFDRQLDVARQQQGPGDQSSMPAERAASFARPAPAQSQKSSAEPAESQKADKGSTTATSSTASTESPGKSKSADASRKDTADSPAEAAHPMQDDAAALAGAATLAGAMLALLPTAAAALKPAVAGAADGSVATTKAGAGNGNVVAGALDQQAAALLQTGDAANAAAAAPANTSAVSDGLLAATATGLPSLELGKHARTGIDQATSMLAATSSAATPLPPMLVVRAPVGSQAFHQELGQQVAWLGGQAGEAVKQASIRLHPQDLGQLDVKISMNQGKVDVVFNAQHPAAVTAVQQTLPQLNHLLAQHGLSLGHAEVGQQQNHSAGQHDSRQGSASLAADIDDMQTQGISMPVSISSVGLLDAFA